MTTRFFSNARIALAIIVAFSCCLTTKAQNSIKITGDRLSGIVLPIEPISADITISALRVQAWDVDDTKRLHLEGDVLITIGEFSFSSDEAVVWINRIPSANGLINQIAIYFNKVEDPQRRAGMGVDGNRLLVTGSAIGGIKLNVTLLKEGRREERSIVKQAEERLADYLKKMLASNPTLESYPQVDAKIPYEVPPIVVGGTPPSDFPDLPDKVQLPTVDVADRPLFIPTGSISINAGNIVVETNENENVIVATGSLVVEYADNRDENFSRLTLSAQRGVIFTKPGAISEIPSLSVDADFVRGIYLEGNVTATDGDYTIRGTRVYYDIQKQQAIMLDGVVRTYSRLVKQPIYARAEEFRQVSQNQWTAKKATVSTSEFFTPHLAIGARRVTVTRRPGVDNPRDTETYLVGKNNTIEVAGVPVFFWPHIEGTIQDTPLKSIEVGTRDNNGLTIQTGWDPYALLGLRAPNGIDATLKIDGYAERGLALGLEFDYKLPNFKGLIDLYGIWDDGVDKTSSGLEVDVDSAFRGVALWEHEWELKQDLVLQAQLSHISDPSFVSSFREDDFAERREYESTVFLRNYDENTAWTALAKVNEFDFISNSWLLASRQYQVEKLPEFTYRRYGDSIFNDTVTYSSEYRVSRMSLSLDESTPANHGVHSRAFGIGPDDPLDDMLRARGLSTQWVNRFDTRQEFSAPSNWSIFDVTPFIVLRGTLYDNDFDEFSSDSDASRLFAAAGLRVSTVFQHINNDFENSLFDIHRVRHLVEPNITVWYGWSDVDQFDLPVYDEAVESLATGAAFRLGLLNTWQTQRGGPGRWRSVDFLTVDTAVVLTSSDTDIEHPVPQFYKFRPEYSNLGDHFSGTLTWLLSDSLSIVGETIYDLDDTRIARGSVGAQLQHSPIFSTYAEFRYIDASDNNLLDVGWTYQLTPKYKIGLSPQWDFRNDEFRSIRMRVTRSFPDFDFTVGVKHDAIRDETALSAQMQLKSF